MPTSIPSLRRATMQIMGTDESVTTWPSPLPGPADGLFIMGHWLFVASSACLPEGTPRPTAVPVGCLQAIELNTNQAMFPMVTQPAPDYLAHREAICAMDAVDMGAEEPILLTGGKDGAWRRDGGARHCHACVCPYK